MSAGLQPTDGFLARVVEGRALAEQGDFRASEEHFRALLDEAREEHAGNHAMAMQSLITLYGRGGRYLEAHMLARRLAQRAREEGPAADKVLAFALGAICGALSQLDLDQPLGEALSDLRTVLDRAPVPLTNLELEYLAAAGVHARGRGDHELARRHWSEYRRIVQETEGLEQVFHWAMTMGGAQLAYHEGNYPLARHLVGQLGAGSETPPFHRLKELALTVSVHAALGERDEARPLAREALDILRFVKDEEGLASGRIHEGAVLARELERLNEWGLAASAYDLVAAAVLIRLRQVDACTRELPELGLDDAESSAVLGRFRHQFVREQQVLLRRVAAVYEARGDEFIQSLIGRGAAEGFVSICAWCESVRPEDGRWLPLGHFIPRDGTFDVTHAICPPCADAMQKTSA